MGSIVIVALVISVGFIALRGYRWMASAPTKLEKLGYIGLEDATKREADVLAECQRSGHPIHRASRSPPAASELSAGTLTEAMLKINTIEALLSNSALQMTPRARAIHKVSLAGVREQLQDLTRSVNGDEQLDALRFNRLLRHLRGIEEDIIRPRDSPPALQT